MLQRTGEQSDGGSCVSGEPGLISSGTGSAEQSSAGQWPEGQLETVRQTARRLLEISSLAHYVSVQCKESAESVSNIVDVYHGSKRAVITYQAPNATRFCHSWKRLQTMR